MSAAIEDPLFEKELRVQLTLWGLAQGVKEDLSKLDLTAALRFLQDQEINSLHCSPFSLHDLLRNDDEEEFQTNFVNSLNCPAIEERRHAFLAGFLALRRGESSKRVADLLETTGMVLAEPASQEFRRQQGRQARPPAQPRDTMAQIQPTINDRGSRSACAALN